MPKPIPGKARPNPPLGSPLALAYDAFEQAVRGGSKAVALYRGEFISACMRQVDELRVRGNPQEKIQGEVVQEKYLALKPVCDHLSKWALVESQVTPQSELIDIVVCVLEQLGELKLSADGASPPYDHWLEGHAIFTYETFLAIVAALLKSGAYKTLHEIYASRYFLPSLAAHEGRTFVRFNHFYGDSEILNSILAEEGRKFYAPAAELIRRNADNADIPLAELQQADALSFMMSLIIEGAWWYPQTLYYVTHSTIFPFFARAEEREGFLKLAEITGIASADDLRSIILPKVQRMPRESIQDPAHNFWNLANMPDLDALR